MQVSKLVFTVEAINAVIGYKLLIGDMSTKNAIENFNHAIASWI